MKQAASPQERLARSIVRSKVQPPPVRPSTLERSRLLQWLTSHTVDRLTFVTGEAGYGKTTLLADFARRTAARCMWYRLDPTDRDGVTFITYLVAAVRELQPDFGCETARLLAQMHSTNFLLEPLLDSLLSELPGIGQAPTLLILDDFQAVDGSPHVHTILSRIFERAPQNLGVVIASRVAPSLRVGRLAAQGQVGQLDTDDLRFSSEETADLFAVAYQHPLEPDLVEEIDARAEGWAASLQLVFSSIRERRPSDARAFIQSLSGADGALYDYLAEEVLASLAPPLQRVLVRASLLDRIVPNYVMAVLSTEPEPPTAPHLAELLDEADHLGLMGRRAAGAMTRRFHPLLREYLRRQLEISISADRRLEMHSRVARAAEAASDWLVACHHYIESEQPSEAMRVLSDSAAAVVGAGALGASMALTGRAGAIEVPSVIKVIEARHLMSIGAMDRAAEVLAQLDPASAPPQERALAVLAQVHAAFKSGRTDMMQQFVDSLIDDDEVPTGLNEIGRAWQLMLEACRGSEIRLASHYLAELGARQAQAHQWYFAGISFHNAAQYEAARGEFLLALQLAEAAVSQFAKVDSQLREVLSTRALIASVCWELGYVDRAQEETRRLERSTEADPDAHADCAWNLAMTGEQVRAVEFLSRAHDASLQLPSDTGMVALLSRYDAAIAAAGGQSATLHDIVDDPAGFANEPDFLVRNWLVRCTVVGLDDPADAATLARRGLRFAEAQGAVRAMARLRVALAAFDLDGPQLEAAINRASALGELSLLELADVIVGALHCLPTIPKALTTSIESWPNRWLPALRRGMGRGNQPAAHVAMRLLAEHGSMSDASRIVAFEKTYLRAGRHRNISRRLILRMSPRLTIHDLGRSVLEIGAMEVDLVKARRRAASLLMFLVTRPRQTATREQVIEELWPALGPDAASNSLNQTLYFLRRDIDPWYDEMSSADYVINESELVWLDPKLVAVDSVRFHDQATGLLSSGKTAAEGPIVLAGYQGRFSPEFEYEEWAMGWRERVHAVYLMGVHATQKALTEIGAHAEAVDVLLRALAVDPAALEIEVSLVRGLRYLGAEAAATEQYSHLARLYRSELGIEAPSYDSMGPETTVQD